MTTLHLGVVDVAYTQDGQSTTTGDVAEILEENYGVMRTFVALHEKDIGNAMVEAIKGEIENLMMGIQPGGFGALDNPEIKGSAIEKADNLLKKSGSSAHAMSKIESMFRDYLDDGEYEKTSGLQIEAAKSGVNHRKKRPYVKANPARPAFVDTRLYQASFRAWIEDN